MQLFRALLVDRHSVHRRRVREVLEESHIECFEIQNLGEALPILARSNIDLVVSELQPASSDGLTLDLMFRSGIFGPLPPPVILYFDPFEMHAPVLMDGATANAILIPAPVSAADLDAALDRAFGALERETN